VLSSVAFPALDRDLPLIPPQRADLIPEKISSVHCAKLGSSRSLAERRRREDFCFFSIPAKATINNHVVDYEKTHK
jgi:hypothetical protein